MKYRVQTVGGVAVAIASALLFNQYVSKAGVNWQLGGQPLVLFITAVGYLVFLRQMARSGRRQQTPLPAELRTLNRVIALAIGVFGAWFGWPNAACPRRDGVDLRVLPLAQLPATQRPSVSRHSCHRDGECVSEWFRV